MADDPARATEATVPAEPSPPAPSVQTHLVYLDVDDEITSAAARIRASESQQITLVLPFGSRLATSRINFRLLAREATERGKRLDIVCADASARALAAAAGLPVHASVAAYEAARGGSGGAAPSTNGHDRPTVSVAGSATIQLALPELADDEDAATKLVTLPRRSSPRVPMVGPARPPVPPRVAIAAGVGVVAALVILGLLALQLLPAATIVLHPRSQQVGPLSLTVQARSDVTTIDEANLILPAQRFTFELEASQAISASGTKVVDAKATGEVVFSNFDTGSGVLIPKGTIVRTRDKDHIEFATLAELTLPKAQVDFFPPFPTHPSTGTVGIQAVVAGDTGNVGNNTITDIPSAGRLLKVNNPEPTSGGAHTESTVISQKDVDAALAAINAALQTDLDTQLASGVSIPSAVTLFHETKSVGEPEFATDPQTFIGTEATAAEVQATAEGSVLGVDPSPIQGLVESRLDAEVDEGWTLQDGSTTVDLGEPSVAGDAISFPVSVAATEVHDVDREALLKQISGLVAAQARSRLEVYGDVSISLWPDWVTTIPTNGDRVELTIAAPQPAPSPSP
jgi:baseplate J-like protein